MDNIEAPGLSTVQAGVQVVQQMTQCGMSGSDYEVESQGLFGLMHEFALREIRQNGFPQATDEVTSEELENTPVAEAYWAATSTFFRKVFQATAAAA